MDLIDANELLTFYTPHLIGQSHALVAAHWWEDVRSTKVNVICILGLLTHGCYSWMPDKIIPMF